MPSPFPGMNPYLEGNRWLAFHGDLCTEVRRQLAPQLAPRYYPDTTIYYVVETPKDIGIVVEQIIPDVGVARTAAGSGGAPAAALSAAPVQMTTVLQVPVPHYRIDIRDVEKRKLVTAIEFLSPSNKRGKGRRQYLRKREKILASSAHLIEIDLLRRGKRLPMREPFPPASYYVLVSRAEKRPVTDVWPIQLTEPLPDVPVPLLPGDPDVSLALQQAVDNVCDLGRFDLTIDYKKLPDAPLGREQADWIDQRLRQAGLRS